MATITWTKERQLSALDQTYVMQAANIALNDNTAALPLPIGGLKTLILAPSSPVETGTITMKLVPYNGATYAHTETFILNKSFSITLDTNAYSLDLTASSLVGTCNAAFIYSSS